jgi:hypothetical protein
VKIAIKTLKTTHYLFKQENQNKQFQRFSLCHYFLIREETETILHDERSKKKTNNFSYY